MPQLRLIKGGKPVSQSARYQPHELTKQLVAEITKFNPDRQRRLVMGLFGKVEAFCQLIENGKEI